MKKYIVVLLLFIFTILPASAQKCRITGTFDELITNLKLMGELLSYQDFSTGYSEPDASKCSFEIISKDTGLYSCPVNATVSLDILTDEKLNPNTIILLGKIKNNRPTETALDWAFAITNVGCLNTDMKWQDTWDIYMETLTEGYYESRTMAMYSGPDPNDPNNTWEYIVANK